MLNVIPVSALTMENFSAPESFSCPICLSDFASEQKKAEHLDRAHPNWAATMMFGYLKQIPRENG
jgi:hypothetical protein